MKTSFNFLVKTICGFKKCCRFLCAYYCLKNVNCLVSTCVLNASTIPLVTQLVYLYTCIENFPQVRLLTFFFDRGVSHNSLSNCDVVLVY